MTRFGYHAERYSDWMKGALQGHVFARGDHNGVIRLWDLRMLNQHQQVCILWSIARNVLLSFLLFIKVVTGLEDAISQIVIQDSGLVACSDRGHIVLYNRQN